MINFLKNILKLPFIIILSLLYLLIFVGKCIIHLIEGDINKYIKKTKITIGVFTNATKILMHENRSCSIVKSFMLYDEDIKPITGYHMVLKKESKDSESIIVNYTLDEGEDSYNEL